MVTFNWTPVVTLPPVTRGLVLGLVFLSGIHVALRFADNSADSSVPLVPNAFPWLLVVPGTTLWYPWTLLTAAFVETNIIEFIVSAITLALGGRYLERVWGQIELLKFVFVVAVASNLVSVLVNFAESFVLSQKAFFLYGMNYHGLMGVQTGFLVAFTQLIPEHQVQLLGGLAKVRVKSLPMLYVTISNVACLIGYQSPYILIQFGWLASWAYLRFFKYNEDVEWRGDRSETFSFVSWFPPFVQRIITPLVNAAFNLFVRLRLLPAWSNTDLEGGMSLLGGAGAGSALGGGHAGPGGARAEAERRRAMALKALDQRMATSGTSATSSKPVTPVLPTASSLSESTSSNRGGSVAMQASMSSPSPATNTNHVPNGSALHAPTSPVMTKTQPTESSD